MENPWTALPKEPDYVLKEDEPYVRAFNRAQTKDRFELDLSLIPEPFLGPRTGVPLILLLLNPGKTDQSQELHRGSHSKRLRANLGDDPEGQRHLGLRKDAPSPWWQQRLSAVCTEGHDPEDLSRKVLSVEFHGYYSRSRSLPPVTLPSQKYGFWLVESAIERGATIVTLRGERLWSVAVPSLYGYERSVVARNPRAGSVSPANLGRRGFEQVIEALE